MGRSSTRENKTRYQLAREELGLSREKASELLETIAPERIEKIESERSLPRPDEVLIMAEKYKTPSLCNYFCARQCPIGQQYVPEIRNSELSDIVLKMLASLNAMDRKKERLIEIAADGTISKDEIDDFVRWSASRSRWKRCSFGWKRCWPTAGSTLRPIIRSRKRRNFSPQGKIAPLFC